MGLPVRACTGCAGEACLGFSRPGFQARLGIHPPGVLLVP